MQDNIEFTLNGIGYSVGKASFVEGFCWSNSRDEEGALFPTLLEAQQDAINWKAGRRERYEGSDEEAEDARHRHLNQRTADAKGK